MMCGNAGASGCSPKVLYEFFGDKTVAHVPFQINYKTFNSTQSVGRFTPINPRVVPCNQSVDGIKPPCSCMDCSLTYTQVPSTSSKPDELIFGLRRYTFLMICVFFIGSMTFVVVSSYSEDKLGNFYMSFDKLLIKINYIFTKIIS